MKYSFLVTKLFILVCSLIFAACGGGGSSPTNPTTGSKTVSGIAAAGAPIVGIVNIKGTNGGTDSANIDLDGQYSIDVSNIDAPFILFATGSVNGRSLKIYSAGISTGTINITPVTDFILRNALANPVDSTFASWETAQIDAASLSSAEADVQAQLAPLLDAIGIDPSVDLISTVFSADHTGIDAALDVLDISYSGNTATVINTLTGSSYTDDTTIAGDIAGLPTTDTDAAQAILSDAVAIDAIWHDVAAMITTIPYPSSQTWADWVNTSVASNYLWGGETKSELLADLQMIDDDPDGNLTFDAVIMEPLDVTATAYDRGYWIRVFEDSDEGSESFVVGMVYNGVNWLLYGDQKWLDIDGVNPHAFYADFNGTFGTGFELGIDDDSNYAYDQGVRSAIVTGPGLPADGVLLAHQFPETSLDLYINGGGFYEINDDALIATIPDNAEYTHTLCSEAADDLNNNGHNTCTVLKTYTTIEMKPPLPKSALNASMFATLTSPSSHDLSDLNFGTLINVSWTNPVSTFSGEIGLNWMTSGQSFWVDDEGDVSATTATLDTIGLPAPDTGWATIFVRVSDIYGRDYNRHWWFSSF